MNDILEMMNRLFIIEIIRTSDGNFKYKSRSIDSARQREGIVARSGGYMLFLHRSGDVDFIINRIDKYKHYTSDSEIRDYYYNDFIDLLKSIGSEVVEEVEIID